MNVKGLMPSRRRLTFSLVIVMIIAIFFIGYNFYFIPGNKDTLHKNAFLILADISKSAQERNNDVEKLLSSYFPGRGMEELQMELDSNKIGAKVFRNTGAGKIKLVQDTGISSGMERIFLAGISNDTLYYLPSGADSLGIKIPARNFLDPLLTYQRSELFSAYLLIGKKTGPVYIDPSLAVASSITEDSLVSKNNDAFFAGVKDIVAEDTKYKMFYYPIKLGSDDLRLCGFLKASTYFNELHQVPVNFIYPLVIALLLIIILLPVIKFFMMDMDEHIKFTDFILGVLSIFVGAAMLTIIIIQVLLLLAADIRAKEYLTSISGDIDANFKNELHKAYVQLDKLDSVINAHHDSLPFKSDKSGMDGNVSDLVQKYFVAQPAPSSLYYNFNPVSWVDSAGEQRLKAQIDNSSPVLRNVEERNYFRVVLNGGGYAVPDVPGAKCGFEPINSWTNGEFSIIVSKKSLLQNGYVATLTTQMYSVMNTILPPGFGFCIIDETGKVMLHSEMNRSLRENFIAKCQPSRQLKESMISRQDNYFNNIALYGNDCAVYIRPIKDMPFHLVTFYDKGYIVPVNLRILSFSVVFWLLSFVSCLLLWLVVFRRKNPSNILLNSPMQHLKWVIPKKTDIKFYSLSSLFLLVYLALQLLAIVPFNKATFSNYTVLVLLLLLPVNIFCGLFVINYRVKKDMTDVERRHKLLSKWKVVFVILFQLAASIIANYFSNKAEYPLQAKFLIYSFSYNFFLWLIFLLPKRSLSFLDVSASKWHKKIQAGPEKIFNRIVLFFFPSSYLTHYNRFAILLVICLTVLPASLYTWYAHNQEISQSVKKGQLYLATRLKQRSSAQVQYYKERLQLNPPDTLAENLQYKWGLYKIYNDSIAPAADTNGISKTNESFERFYFSIANDIGNNYYDPLLYPPLRDNATDNTWFWSKSKDTMSFWYSLYPSSGKTVAGVKKNGKILEIISPFPERYKFFERSLRGLLLMMVIICFIFGLYWLIRYINIRLFLKKFITGKNDDSPDKIISLFNEFKRSKEARGESAGSIKTADIEKLPEEHKYYRPATDSIALYQQEKTMIESLEKYKDFYNFIWNKCTDNQKYLLMNLAQSGFANFKNTSAIYHLVNMGVLREQQEELKIFSASFRAYVIKQKYNKDNEQLQKEFQQESSWQSFRLPLLLIVLGVAMFIFFTQEQVFQKILALVGGIGTLVSLLLKFFTDGTSLFSAKK